MKFGILYCFLLGLVLISNSLAMHSKPIHLGHKEPKRVFDERSHTTIKGPFRDSLYCHPHLPRDAVPLSGGIGHLGTYFAEIDVASQTFRVIVDTGSSVLYVPSTDCTLANGPSQGEVCSSYNPPLDPAKAGLDPIPCSDVGCTCNDQEQCAVRSNYGDGSFVGGIGYKANVSIGNLSAPGSFVASTFSSDGFVNDQGTELDGIWGMGYQEYPRGSMETIPPVLFSIWDYHPDVPRVFAIELDHKTGSLMIGGYEERYVKEPIQYTDIIAHGWYVIHNPKLYTGLSPATLASRDVDAEGITTIVDSGSTLIVLPPTYWDSLKNGMEKVSPCSVKYMCGHQSIFSRDRYCYTDFPFDDFPTVAFSVPLSKSSDSDPDRLIPLILTPRQYMVKSVDRQGNDCVSFGFIEGSGNFLILGDTLMTQYYTIFDVERDLVGFSSKFAYPEFVPLPPYEPIGSSPFSDAASSLLNFRSTFLFVVFTVYVVLFFST